ncbi:type VI secretion system Vgr family protein [Veronia pacifica]|uniref:Type IV secretion protein Rhs n=1 Tax=Veronia pacifica TaxID=1080227 RepID=A0A1C3EDR2_9GAMM|nr:type VI secretion system tip protein TssI/VgrG [Veronia pacifica]ODA31359.1 type IV secretion protein Rhs [Veronia pacifica]
MSGFPLRHQSRVLTVKLSDGNQYAVTHFHCIERLSSASEFSFTLSSSKEISNNILGNPIKVRFQHADSHRDFHGLASSLELTDHSPQKQRFYYRIEALDPLSLLSHSRRRQVFQNLTTKQIIETLLSQSGLKKYVQFSVSGSGKKHPYCVQLEESDLQFIQRLLADDGWHYCLSHTESKPMVKVIDATEQLPSLSDPIFYRDGKDGDVSVLSNWRQKASLGTTSVTLADYSADVDERIDSGENKSAHPHSQLSLKDCRFGTGIDNKAALRESAKSLMHSLDNEKYSAGASSSLATLSCGTCFTLKQHPVSANNQTYLIKQITHAVTVDESGEFSGYQNHFDCWPVSFPFVPLRLKKPRVFSAQTALVTGPKGDEIYADKHGRIKVQFHWDTEGKGDENTSCWLPVSQGVASKGFGMQFLPRVGDSVLVQFIDGDPDRPLVVGSYYGQNQISPFSSVTQCGIKTRSTPNGSSTQGNELRFDDQKDKEQVFVHAEKDLAINVNNDSQHQVKGTMTMQAEKAMTLSAKETLTASSDQDINISGKEGISLNSGQKVQIHADSEIEVSSTSSHTFNGSELSLSGKSKITLSVGASKIEIAASGITIDAPSISIKGSAKAELSANMVTVDGQMTTLKGQIAKVEGGTMTTVKAGALLKIQGALTQIN